ncbi:hypothetical protein HDU98_003647 [Podochytrium sp. JEL0797]|nr:hypothetical protein HDU98_003647 [Podochytrium sp. JEL0797]
MSSNGTATDVSLGNFEAAIITNGALCAVFFVLFFILRPRFIHTYESRIQAVRLEKLPKQLGMSPFGVFEIFSASDKELIAKCGQDAFAAIFYARTLAIFFITITLPAMIVLIPINATGSGGVEGLNLLSFGNIIYKQKLWAHFLYTVFVILTCLYTIFYILGQTAQLRSAFLLQRGREDISGRTLLVRDVPLEWRNTKALTDLFNRVNPGSVTAVVIPKPIPKELYDLTAKQVKTRDALEASVSAYFSQLAKHFHLGCEPSEPVMPSANSITGSPVLQKTSAAAAPKTGGEDVGSMFRPTHRTPAVFGKKVDSINEYSHEFRKLDVEGAKLRDKFGLNGTKVSESEEAEHVGLAFIVFKDPFLANLAAKLIVSEAPVVMSDRIPNVDAKDVVWENVNMGYFERQGRAFFARAIMAAMIIFWAILVAAVLSFADLSSLGQHIPALGTFLNSQPTLAKIVGGVLPPVIVSVLLSLVPPILRVLLVQSGSILNTQIERDVYDQYFGFQIINVFAVNIVGSSILTSFQQIVDDPSSIMQILSQSIPKSSNFFIQYLMVQGLSSPSGQILQITRLILSPIMMFLFGKTPRGIFNARSPPDWQYSTNMAVHGLAVTIGLTYSVIAPIILVFVCCYFALFYFVYAYMMQYVFVLKKETETGGRFLFTAANQIFVGLFLMEFVVWVLFILSKNIGISILTPFMIIITYWAYKHAQKFMAVIDAISLETAVNSQGNEVLPAENKDSFSLLRFLFPGLTSSVMFAPVQTKIEGGEEEDAFDVYVDSRTGRTELKVWIPKCAVWGVQADVEQEIFGEGGDAEEGALLAKSRVVSLGASVSDKGAVLVAERMHDVLSEL